MTLKELKHQFHNELKDIFPFQEIDSFYFLTVEKELGFSKSKVLLMANEPMSLGESIAVHKVLTRLKKQEPIQYILGETEFYGMPFKVTPATLIPRPETEELVDWMVSDNENRRSAFTILDIGTGSGCIAIALAKHLPNAQVTALDVSNAALTVATRNAQINKVAVSLLPMDILKANALPETFDIIVSNPPYVRVSEKTEMQKNVLDFEPASALFVEDAHPFLFYSKIAQLAQRHLKPNGLLYFEINEYLSKELVEVLGKEHFKSIEVRKDVFGKDRMIKCTIGE
ncbi:MAG: peptide chain release factor N(5)-glutamine methyltransferase [Flavobacteriaceae bacterium]